MYGAASAASVMMAFVNWNCGGRAMDPTREYHEGSGNYGHDREGAFPVFLQVPLVNPGTYWR